MQLLQKAVIKTQALTRPVEPFVDRGMAVAVSLASTVKTKVGRYVCTYIFIRSMDKDTEGECNDGGCGVACNDDHV